ncbi:MAG: QueT transporter family protein [Bacilli bacterium]|nr:QueT transporter family protein [Bacilli bacterium]
MNDNQILIRRIVKNAIVLALYVVLTFASYPVSFGILQFRVSELLVLLCFFNRDYVIGITLGCLLSNLGSPGPMMVWDLLFGTLASLLSCLAVSFSKHLGIAMLFPILINPLLVGAEFMIVGETNASYWWIVGMIMIGEATIIVVSYILYLFIMKKEAILNLIDAKRNRSFKW